MPILEINTTSHSYQWCVVIDTSTESIEDASENEKEDSDEES